MGLEHLAHDDPGGNCHDQQDRKQVAEGETDRIGDQRALVDIAGIAREDGDVEPELVQPLVASQPDTGARKHQHQAVVEQQRQQQEGQVGDDLAQRHGSRPRGDGMPQQSQRQQQLEQRPQVNLFERDQELRVDGLEQREIEPARPDQFTQVRQVGNEERLHQGVENHARRHEAVILG